MSPGRCGITWTVRYETRPPEHPNSQEAAARSPHPSATQLPRATPYRFRTARTTAHHADPPRTPRSATPGQEPPLCDPHLTPSAGAFPPRNLAEKPGHHPPSPPAGRPDPQRSVQEAPRSHPPTHETRPTTHRDEAPAPPACQMFSRAQARAGTDHTASIPRTYGPVAADFTTHLPPLNTSNGRIEQASLALGLGAGGHASRAQPRNGRLQGQVVSAASERARAVGRHSGARTAPEVPSPPVNNAVGA